MLTAASGEVDTLSSVSDKFSGASQDVRESFENLSQISTSLKKRLPATRLYYDLAALKGQSYHNGLVFSVYMPGSGRAIASGGRYDDIGKAFGRARAATGFSLDLRAISSYVKQSDTDSEQSIFASFKDDPALFEAVRQLRQQGRRVIFCYDNEEPDNNSENSLQLILKDGKWIVE